MGGFFYEDEDDNSSWNTDTGAGSNHGPSVPAQPAGGAAPAAKKKGSGWAKKLALIGAGVGGSMLGGAPLGFALMKAIKGQTPEEEEEAARKRRFEPGSQY